MSQCLKNGKHFFSLSKCSFKMLSAACVMAGCGWVYFLHFCTRQSAPDLQIAFIIRHIVHWWIMCGLQSRSTAFKIARSACRPHPQREAGLSEVVSGSRACCICFPRFLRSLFLSSGSSCASLTDGGLETRSQPQFREKTWAGESILKSRLRKLMLFCPSDNFPDNVGWNKGKYQAPNVLCWCPA